MALFPKRVDIDNTSVKELQQLFTDTTKDLQGYLFTLAGVAITKSTIVQVRALIQQRLAKLGISVGNWISTAVPKQYVQGMSDAAAQQASFGNATEAKLISTLADKTAQVSNTPTPEVVSNLLDPGTVQAVNTTAKVISPVQSAFDLHTQSVQATMDSMSNSFGASMQTMGRTADKTITDVQRLDIRRKIAVQANADADTSKIAGQISDLIKNNGISGLVDAGGSQWSPEGYASMLVNTKLTEARNNGMMNAQMSAGNDLVEVSSHGATDACADWEGEILSISGDSDIYDSVDDAISGGLFHPNCEHSLNAVDDSDFPS